MEERFVDAGFVGDFLGAGAGAAAAEKDAVRGVEDALLGVGVGRPSIRDRRFNHWV